MRTSSCKAKGRRLQDKIAKDLGSWEELKNNVKPAIMGESGVDIQLSGNSGQLVPIAIECKNCERWEINKWWIQAQANTNEPLNPVLIVSKNRMPEPLAVVNWKFLEKLLYRSMKYEHP